MRIKWFKSGGGVTDLGCKVLEKLLQNGKEAKVVEHTE